MTRNFGVALSSRSLRMPTPFPHHYRARFHSAALFSLFPVSVSTSSPLSLPVSLIPRLAWFFYAYLRGTYLPELSGNLTPAPSPGRSPPFQHPPTVLSKLSLTFPDLSAHTYRQTHAHYPRTRRFSDGRKLWPDIILVASLTWTLLLDVVDMSVSCVVSYIEFYYREISAKFVCICSTGSPFNVFFPKWRNVNCQLYVEQIFE